MIDNLRIAELLRGMIEAVVPEDGEWYTLSVNVKRERKGKLLHQLSLVKLEAPALKAGDHLPRDEGPLGISQEPNNDFTNGTTGWGKGKTARKRRGK